MKGVKVSELQRLSIRNIWQHDSDKQIKATHLKLTSNVAKAQKLCKWITDSTPPAYDPTYLTWPTIVNHKEKANKNILTCRLECWHNSRDYLQRFPLFVWLPAEISCYYEESQWKWTKNLILSILLTKEYITQCSSDE